MIPPDDDLCCLIKKDAYVPHSSAFRPSKWIGLLSNNLNCPNPHTFSRNSGRVLDISPYIYPNGYRSLQRNTNALTCSLFSRSIIIYISKFVSGPQPSHRLPSRPWMDVSAILHVIVLLTWNVWNYQIHIFGTTHHHQPVYFFFGIRKYLILTYNHNQVREKINLNGAI